MCTAHAWEGKSSLGREIVNMFRIVGCSHLIFQMVEVCFLEFAFDCDSFSIFPFN